MINKFIITCPTKFHSDHVAYAFYKKDILEKVITGLPKGYYTNRHEIPYNKVKNVFSIMVIPLLFNKITKGKFKMISKWLDIFFLIIYDFITYYLVKPNQYAMIWGWAGLRTIKRAKKNNTITIVQQSASANLHQNNILKDEYRSFGLNFRDRNPYYIIRRQMNEAKIADYVLCPSKYVADTFINCYGIHKNKVLIVPYGADINRFKKGIKNDDTFRIIYIGTVNVRKGIIYLLEAVKRLRENNIIYELIIIGPIDEYFLSIFEKYSRFYKYYGKLNQKELNDYLINSSVFVLPSLDEGLAIVQLEAIACGLPIISTPNSGCESIITEGEEGFIVPIRDSKAIYEKLKYLYENPEVLNVMSEKAYKRSQGFTWDKYVDRLLEIFDN